MIIINSDILEKHAVGIQAAMNYYVNNLPTGITDQEYDILERAAEKDGLSLRDYVSQFIQGKRSHNADYIGKVEKLQVTGVMSEALREYQKSNPNIDHWLPKYDGSSLAVYYDPNSGRPIRVVTIGGSNLGGEGIDQTEKFIKYFPNLPNTGIIGLQCECLVALHHGLGDKSRQKANGLVNSSYQPLDITQFKGKDYQKYLEDFYKNNIKVQSEVDDLITLRCFRYFLDLSFPGSETTLKLGHRKVLESLPIIYNSKGDIKFCGAYTFTEFPSYIESDIWDTPTGTFLVDGVVGYTKEGICVKALKYKDAGRGEFSEVLGIQWNDQSFKGKDSWSANAIITPITVRGTTITKPTVGSIKKMVETGLSKGAKVTVILANSTIPQVNNVITPGNLDYEWPTCSCGYRMGIKDVYGSLIKCGNLKCNNRETRMRNYLSGISSFDLIDLNKLLIIDRWNWKEKTNYSEVLEGIKKNCESEEDLYNFLSGYLTTDLLRRNLKLVIYPAFITLSEYVRSH